MEHLWPTSPLVFVLAWFGWRIANKAGYSGFWGLLALIPPLGLIALWYLAATGDWPRRSGTDTTGRPDDGPETGPAKGVTIRRPGNSVTRT